MASAESFWINSMECLENRDSCGWGGADSKLVEFEVDVSGGQRILVSRTGVHIWI